MNDNYVFEEKYRLHGMATQRQYPNESLIQFFGTNLFKLSPSERRSAKVLEVGCGSGANLWMVAREGFQAHGIDIAETGVKLCKEKLNQWGVSAKLKVANMKALPYEDGTFDVIYDVHSIQHNDLEGHRTTYREVFRCLKASGLFFQFHLGKKSYSHTNGGGVHLDQIAIDNVHNPSAPYSNDGLVSFLDPDIAEELLSESGFIDITIDSLLRYQQHLDITTEYLSITCRTPGE